MYLEEGEILEGARVASPTSFEPEETQQDGNVQHSRTSNLQNIISAINTLRELSPNQTNFFPALNSSTREELCEYDSELPAHFRGLPSALGNVLHLGQPSCPICFCILTDASQLPCGKTEYFNF